MKLVNRNIFINAILPLLIVFGSLLLTYTIESLSMQIIVLFVLGFFYTTAFATLLIFLDKAVIMLSNNLLLRKDYTVINNNYVLIDIDEKCNVYEADDNKAAYHYSIYRKDFIYFKLIAIYKPILLTNYINVKRI